MSVRTARLLAVPLALLALACRLGQTLWLRPLTWRIGSVGAGALVELLLTAASVVIPVGGYLLLTRRARPRATWQVDLGGHSFVAPAAPRWIGGLSVSVGWVAGGAILTERVPDRDLMRIADFGYGPVSSVVVAVVILAAGIVVLFSNRPRLTVDPDAISLRSMVKRLRIGSGRRAKSFVLFTGWLWGVVAGRGCGEVGVGRF